MATQGGVHHIPPGGIFPPQMVDVPVEVTRPDQIQDQGRGKGAHATAAVEQAAARQAFYDRGVGLDPA